MTLAEKIKNYLLSQIGMPASTRWISSKIKEQQEKTSRELRKMVKAGIVLFETRREFDFEFSHRIGRSLPCRRMRNYYWIPAKSRKMARQTAITWKTSKKGNFSCFFGDDAKGGEIIIESIKSSSDKGNYRARLSKGGESDDSWPRYYFALAYAKSECEAWIKRRLSKT